MKSLSSKFMFAALMSTSALSVPALAESAPAPSSSGSNFDEEIMVVEKYLSRDKMNSVKTPTPILDVPQSLSIVGSEQIAAQAFTNIGDIMRYTPGLSISQGEGHRDSIIIRGNQSTADFFIDGLRDDVQYFRPLYNLEQVEILRGSNALLFGRGGGGGVINRVTKRAEIGQQFIGATASVNTFGAYNMATDINVDLNEKSAFRLNAFYEEMDNHRDFFGGERFAINPTLTFKASEDTSINLSYEYVDDDRTVDRGVPSQNVENGPNVPLKGYRDTFFGSPDQNFTTLQAHIFRTRVNHTFSDEWSANLTAQYADYDKVYQNLYASDSVTVVNGSFDQVELDGYRDTTNRENLIIQANLVGEFELGGFKHTLVMGGEFGDQDTENARFDNVFAANNDDQLFIDFSDPLAIPSFSFSKTARDRASDVQFFSAYIQDQVDVTDWLKLLAGARYDRFEIDVNDVRNNGEFSRTDEEVTPRLGAILKPQKNISAYVSYSETFLPRSGEQFLTLNLDSESTKPQFFENKEVGIKWDINDNLSLTAAVFELERESFTSVDPENPEQVIVIEGSETKGFEIQLAGSLTDFWYMTAGYSYLDGEVDRVDGSGNNGNRTRQTPENMFSIWNQFKATDRLSFGVGATYQDSYFVREDNNVEVPDYIRVDAAVYYQLTDTVRLQVNVENLFDETYYPDAHANNNISTGAPLNARFTISTKF